MFGNMLKKKLRKYGKPFNDKTLIDEMANELQYFPIENEMFVSTGWKLFDKRTEIHTLGCCKK